MKLRRRVDRSESGFTLVECVAAFVIMGLIMAPLATAAIQAMKIPPTNGDRTQLATDGDRLLTQYADDISSAQHILSVLTINGTLNITNEFQVQSGAWTTHTTPATPVLCANPAPNLGWLLNPSWQDNGVGAGATNSALYAWSVTGSGPLYSVAVVRQYNGLPAVTYLTGYCQAGDPTITIETDAPGGANNPFNEEVKMTITMRDRLGNMEAPIVLDAMARATCTDPQYC